MRIKVVNVLTLAFLLAGVSLGLGQTVQEKDKKVRIEKNVTPSTKTGTAAPEKSKLEEMLAQALKNNPDIRVAAAKVATAEAELNRTRLQVTQEVARLHAGLATQQAMVNHQARQLERYQDLRNRGRPDVDAKLVDEKQDALLVAKAKLTELEAQLNALLGKTPRAAEDSKSEVRRAAIEAITRMQPANETSVADAFFRQILVESRLQGERKPAGPMADRIRKALQTPVKVNYKSLAFQVVLEDLMKQVPGLSIRSSPRVQLGFVNLHFEEALPVSAILQALEDEFDIRFVVRDYGLLVTHAAMAPPGAMRLEELLRPKKSDTEKTPGDKQGAADQPAGVEGRVISVDAPDRVRISLGVKDGVHVGDRVDVYRPGEKPIYLGELRIGGTGARDAIGKPRGRLAVPIQPGDKVISHNSRPWIQFSSKADEKSKD